MENIEIIKLDRSRWKEYKELRFEAVTDSPPSFLDTIEETVQMEDKIWIQRLEKAQSGNDSVIFFAEESGKLIGMIASFIEPKQKESHIANIVSFYVSKGYRGKGIGKKLIEEVLHWIKSKPNEKVHLGVYEGNPAQKLYEKVGFKSVGKITNTIKVDDVYYDDIMMEKFL